MDLIRVKNILFIIAVAVGSAGALYLASRKPSARESTGTERTAAVEVAEIEVRDLRRQRTFSGALEAGSKFVIAPKVGGRIDRLLVDLSDRVERGMTIAILDDAEFAQAVKQAEAEKAVAGANLVQARNALEISQRENQRILELRESGIASDSQYDIARADLLQKESQLEVAKAQVDRAEAALESARIRLGYTRVVADWTHGSNDRVVAERFVDEGQTVSENEPLFLIVELDPISAVIHVTERDYGQLMPGLEARFQTDAFPGEVFTGRVENIAPVFRESSRQARIEMNLANPDGRLKPGMFIRATITLDRVEGAVAIPDSAVTRRDDEDGVFMVDKDGRKVHWVPVALGIRDSGWVQVLSPDLSGRVVTLGQHMVDDGASIKIAGYFNAGLNP